MCFAFLLAALTIGQTKPAASSFNSRLIVSRAGGLTSLIVSTNCEDNLIFLVGISRNDSTSRFDPKVTMSFVNGGEANRSTGLVTIDGNLTQANFAAIKGKEVPSYFATLPTRELAKMASAKTIGFTLDDRAFRFDPPAMDGVKILQMALNRKVNFDDLISVLSDDETNGVEVRTVVEKLKLKLPAK